jgi:hypothetical protein
MKAIHGKLDITHKYTIKSLHASYKPKNDDTINLDWEFCENCGKALANWAIVERDDGKTFLIGMDCAEALTNLDSMPLSSLEFMEQKKQMNRKRRFLKYMHTKCKSVILWGDNCLNCMDIDNGKEFHPLKLSYKIPYNEYKPLIDDLVNSGKIAFYRD